MKIHTLIAASALVVVTSFSAVVSANISDDALKAEVDSAVRERGVRVSVDGGVVTLFGNVETRVQKDSARASALKSPDVEKVVNLINIENS